MKTRMIAIALVIVMLFALSACGNEAAAPAAQPAAQTEAPAAAPADQPADQPADKPAEDPLTAAMAKGIPDGSGVVTKASEGQGFSIDFDSDKYVAMENLVGNIDIFAGQDEGIPKCSVSLHLKENSPDAAAYLKSIAQNVAEEKGKDMVSKAGEPAKVSYGDRDLYYIAFTFKDKNAGGNVMTVYYAENLKSGDVAVYTSSALEGQTQDVDSILALAIQSFKFGA